MDFKITLQYPRQEVNTKSKENTKFLKQILRKKEMKKFFAIALAFVMFAATNMFADGSSIGTDAKTAEATINVQVLKQIEIDPTNGVLNYAVVNGTVQERAIDASGAFVEAGSLDFDITATEGYELSYSFDLISILSNNSTVDQANAPIITFAGTPLLTGTLENADGEESLSFSVENIDAQTNTCADGGYTYNYTLSVYYTGF